MNYNIVDQRDLKLSAPVTQALEYIKAKITKPLPPSTAEPWTAKQLYFASKVSFDQMGASSDVITKAVAQLVSEGKVREVGTSKQGSPTYTVVGLGRPKGSKIEQEILEFLRSGATRFRGSWTPGSLWGWNPHKYRKAGLTRDKFEKLIQTMAAKGDLVVAGENVRGPLYSLPGKTPEAKVKPACQPDPFVTPRAKVSHAEPPVSPDEYWRLKGWQEGVRETLSKLSPQR